MKKGKSKDEDSQLPATVPDTDLEERIRAPAIHTLAVVKGPEVLTYEDLILPNYHNSATAISMAARRMEGGKEVQTTIEFTLQDVVMAAVLSRLNVFLVSEAGEGKTQLMYDVANHLFGGWGDGGNANYAMGRLNFKADSILMRQQIDLTTGSYDSRSAWQIDPDKARRMLTMMDEMNRCPPPSQNEVMDFANAERAFQGVVQQLGTDGYSVLMAAANLNRLESGGYGGTFGLDDAALNRMHVAFDVDYFRPTPADVITILSAGRGPDLAKTAPRDCGEGILHAYHQIGELAHAEVNEYLLLFSMMIMKGLRYCMNDQESEKGPDWPRQCPGCSVQDQDAKAVCASSTYSPMRTVEAVTRLVYGLNYIAQLKYEEELCLDPVETALQAFKFTTYNGKLNSNSIRTLHGGRDQVFMDYFIEKFTDVARFLRKNMPILREGFTEAYEYVHPKKGDVLTVPYDRLVELLDEKGIQYDRIDLTERAEKKGLGGSWLPDFAAWIHQVHLERQK